MASIRIISGIYLFLNAAVSQITTNSVVENDRIFFFFFFYSSGCQESKLRTTELKSAVGRPCHSQVPRVSLLLAPSNLWLRPASLPGTGRHHANPPPPLRCLPLSGGLLSSASLLQGHLCRPVGPTYVILDRLPISRALV